MFLLIIVLKMKKYSFRIDVWKYARKKEQIQIQTFGLMLNKIKTTHLCYAYWTFNHRVFNLPSVDSTIYSVSKVERKIAKIPYTLVANKFLTWKKRLSWIHKCLMYVFRREHSSPKFVLAVEPFFALLDSKIKWTK